MKKKVLRSMSQSIADMGSSERVWPLFEWAIDTDTEQVKIDILNPVPGKDGKSVVTRDFCSWFLNRLEKEDIDQSLIDEASIEFILDFKSVPSNLKKLALFNISTTARISSNGEEFLRHGKTRINYTRQNA